VDLAQQDVAFVLRDTLGGTLVTEADQASAQYAEQAEQESRDQDG
jgi:hypothetical protein